MRLREVMVELERRLIGVERVGRPHFVKVVGQVGRRHEPVLNRQRRRVHAGGGNDVAKERRVGQRIARLDRRLREVTGALACRGHDRRVAIVGLFLAQAGVAGEEERPVLPDRSAERAAILVPIERILRRRRPRRRPALRVQAFVAEEFEQRALEAVGARLGHDVDDARRVAPVLRRRTVGDDPELLHGFRIWRRVSRAAQAGRVVASIELEVHRPDLGILRAVDRRVLLGAAKRIRALVAGDTAGDRQERVEVAVDQRQIQDLVLPHAA